jgi:YgiT-type zinc finger domain-containing protein
MTRCARCGSADIKPGTTTWRLDRDGFELVVRRVPANVCDACGEAVMTEDAARRVEAIVTAAERNGTVYAVLDFGKAS